jgi:hypothetical protein
LNCAALQQLYLKPHFLTGVARTPRSSGDGALLPNNVRALVATKQKPTRALERWCDNLAFGTGRGLAMDSTAQFVSDLNVARFVEKLRLERDPAMRASLQRLLLKELEKLGFNFERLGNVQCQIAEGRRRIEIQQAVVERLTANGQDVELAKNTLSNLVEIQRIFEQYRQTILDATDRNRAIVRHSWRSLSHKCHNRVAGRGGRQ